MKKYLPYVYSSTVCSVIFNIMTDFFISDYMAYKMDDSVLFIMPIMISVLSAVLFYFAMIKSTGKLSIGLLISVAIFFIVNIVIIIIKTSFPYTLFVNTSGDDPGNMSFMIVWMIYFPSSLIMTGIAVMMHSFLLERTNSMLLRKKYLIILIIISFLTVIFLCSKDNDDIIKYIEKRYSVDLQGCGVMKYEDSHGGFFGDGTAVAVFDVSCWENRSYETEKWKDLPMTEDIELLLYGGTKDGVTYGFDLALNNDIPYIENGRYFFWDRLNDTFSDNDLFSGASFNISVFLLDEDEYKLYFLEFDT
ncbi:MAG: hypothetical protein IKM61_06185 [Eubacteriaceae bacterium]|nr:hypothetical protein [Eubacteriaceae bacterium]